MGPNPMGSIPDEAPHKASFLQEPGPSPPAQGPALSSPQLRIPEFFARALRQIPPDQGPAATQAKPPQASPIPGGDRGPVERGPSGLPLAKPTFGGRSKKPGSAIADIPQPTPEQIDQTLTQVENAGAVTVRNADKVQQSQTAPKDTLQNAAKAVRKYQSSNEYVEITKTTGKPLQETDLSGEMKAILAEQPASDQQRLLSMIHRHGEAAVLAAIAKHQTPRGEY